MKVIVSCVTADDASEKVEMQMHPDFYERPVVEQATILAGVLTLVGDEMVGLVETAVDEVGDAA